MVFLLPRVVGLAGFGQRARSFSHLTSNYFTELVAHRDTSASFACNLHTSPPLRLFWERDRKGGYNRSLKKVSQKQMILEGLKDLKHEINMWKEEVKEKLESDPILVFRPGETDVAWEFQDEQDIAKWVVTSDYDHGEGDSKCTLEMSSAGHGLFSGEVHCRVPVDGKIKRAGYCNIKTIRARVCIESADCKIEIELYKCEFAEIV